MNWQVMADEFSWQAWRLEGAKRVLPPKRWRQTRRWKSLLKRPPAGDIEFLLIESCWENFRRREDRQSAPIGLASAYRHAGIPVIFWNKEDPMCFDDFLPVAMSCDVILTTDSASVPRYRQVGFRGPIEVMTFAAQPQIHRQYSPKDPEKRLFFAGTLRAHHPDRVQGYETVIRPALELGLHIFSRKGIWPDECRDRIVGSFPYLRLLRAYSPYLIGLSMSSVKDSETMFPRRVVELPLANIFVVSDSCRAVANLFPNIPQSHSASRTDEILRYYLRNEAERLEVLKDIKSCILQYHTCASRVEFLRTMAESVA